MKALRRQADILRDACARLRAATAEFAQANQAIRFAAKRTKKRTSGTADIINFQRGRE